MAAKMVFALNLDEHGVARLVAALEVRLGVAEGTDTNEVDMVRA